MGHGHFGETGLREWKGNEETCGGGRERLNNRCGIGNEAGWKSGVQVVDEDERDSERQTG